MAHPSTRIRDKERRAGHARPAGRLQMPHRGIDDATVPGAAGVVPDELDALSPTCGECGFTTKSANVARALARHHADHHA